MPTGTDQTTAIALYSGGLDSTLACRLVAEQGIRVIGVKFVTPFFGYDLLKHREQHIRAVKDKYNIDLRLIDITDDYLELLRNPPHGYGKNFNPCIDCKILLLTKAKEMLTELQGSFLITGEVVGQRPMSQRKDTLRVIERDSGCEDLLVRPLCAKRLPPTQPELNGLIDREQLLDFSGRTRSPQIQLAEKFGIEDYPSPAGGCTLTDPILSKRIKQYYSQHDTIVMEDVRLLLLGRQFRLPHGSWLVLGRKEQENEQVLELYQPNDYLLKLQDRPGPTGLLRYATNQRDLELAAGLMVRYGKKRNTGTDEAVVRCEHSGKTSTLSVQPLEDQFFQSWII
jgi:tRNA U34 2-thiouridine synthase MnmA/TrmU